MGATITMAVAFLQQRVLLHAGNRRALYPLWDWVRRVEKYGDNQKRMAIEPFLFVHVWLNVVWTSLNLKLALPG